MSPTPTPEPRATPRVTDPLKPLEDAWTAHCALDDAMREVSDLIGKLRREADTLRAEVERLRAWAEAARAKWHDSRRTLALTDEYADLTHAIGMMDTEFAAYPAPQDWDVLVAPPVDSPTWPYVMAFARVMERKLALNRHKGDREAWIKDEPLALMARVYEEANELEAAIAESDGPVRVVEEAADVANMAMMAADSYGGLELPAPPAPASTPAPEPPTRDSAPTTLYVMDGGWHCPKCRRSYTEPDPRASEAGFEHASGCPALRPEFHAPTFEATMRAIYYVLEGSQGTREGMRERVQRAMAQQPEDR